ncbi:AAA family ATPase [Sinorhizobium kummerowiae]|uniref:AAA family ATPase n=1 Tax=Sinorhizobium kummerowiae TaxID=158892 RepID=A0ABY8TDA3_9HYPH|nr:AAA family ATPase [Sinorhizobium kummerowiae]WHS94255.1 AAA family ATPase [Sinorhizobium kummerowiae]WRW46186.1 AAA family ATPase [Sinorhizobium kummerowiae]
MAAENRSKLVKMTIRNLGCVGNDGLEIELDNIVCIVGRNNSGKSTLLRAYELAKGVVSFVASEDRFQHATLDQPSEILLEVHIPDGIGNVDPRWKTDRDGLRIVKSRWQWSAPDFTRIRTTWDPTGGENGQGDWAADGKAGGADPVFSSRLPRPLRIGSLDDAQKTEEMLLALALGPLLASVEQERTNKESALFKAIASVSSHIDVLSNDHTEHFNDIATKVATGFQGVFPKMDVRLNIAASPLVPKISDLVKAGSSIRIKDGLSDTMLKQQGTGARRALFWAMLQVHNELTRDKEIRDDFRKRLTQDIGNAERKLAGKKIAEDEKAGAERLFDDLQAKLKAHDAGAPIPDSPDDPALPGYLLLIDEPENALHPMAARAAQRHLYKLAESPDWQVLMTTHSPYFINPFEDHTTIVRLERTGDDKAVAVVSPRTYRSDRIEFDGDDKQRLQALQQIDPSFAEIFFGSYPILVEGDTEHAAFMASVVEKQHELINQVTIIRARGKAILAPLVRVMQHFKIDFGIVHDCDPPFKKNGDTNGMWTENKKIRDAILAARQAGITVRHRISIPDFERFLGGDEEAKDKPLTAYLRIAGEQKLGDSVRTLLDQLLTGEQHEPFDVEAFPAGADYMKTLSGHIAEWAGHNGLADEIRFKGKP